MLGSLVQHTTRLGGIFVCKETQARTIQASNYGGGNVPWSLGYDGLENNRLYPVDQSATAGLGVAFSVACWTGISPPTMWSPLDHELRSWVRAAMWQAKEGPRLDPFNPHFATALEPMSLLPVSLCGHSVNRRAWTWRMECERQ